MKIEGKYIVSVNNGDIDEVEQAVRDAGFEVLQHHEGMPYFSVVHVSEESLETLKAIEGVGNVEQDEWNSLFVGGADAFGKRWKNRNKDNDVQ